MGHVKAQSRLVLTPTARRLRPQKAKQEDEYTRQYNVMLQALQRISKIPYRCDSPAALDIAKKALESVKKGWL